MKKIKTKLLEYISEDITVEQAEDFVNELKKYSTEEQIEVIGMILDSSHVVHPNFMIIFSEFSDLLKVK